MNLIKQLIDKFRKKEIPDYPTDYLEIDYSDIAKRNGNKNEFTMIIIHNFINRNGFRDKKIYPFSQSLLRVLQKVYEIPVLDRTRLDEGFQIYEEVDLGEVKYKK